MKVIFLKEMPRVGNKYDVKEVNDGYAMNFLLPQKIAEVATNQALQKLEKRQKEIQIEREVEEEALNKNLEILKSKSILIKGKANEKGNLFSSVHKKKILEEMFNQHKIEINENFIILEKPIKEIGEFDIPIEIKGKKSSFKLIIENI